MWKFREPDGEEIAKRSSVLMNANGNTIQPCLRTCSACPGEYEDPDRTAWSDDAEDDEDQRTRRDAREDDFPARGSERREGRQQECEEGSR